MRSSLHYAKTVSQNRTKKQCCEHCEQIQMPVQTVYWTALFVWPKSIERIVFHTIRSCAY